MELGNGTPTSSLFRDRRRTPELYPSGGKPRQLPSLCDPDTRKNDDDEPEELYGR